MMNAPYSVTHCPGYHYHPDSCDALGQPRCAICGWSWGGSEDGLIPRVNIGTKSFRPVPTDPSDHPDQEG